MVNKKKALILFMVLAMGITGAFGSAGCQKKEDTIEQKVKSLVAKMTLEEKVGQMIQPDRGAISKDKIKEYYIGSLLSIGGSTPDRNEPLEWADMIDKYEEAAMSTRLSIPLIYGIDAVHGHNNVFGATIFPHNIGLGATNDAKLVYKVGQITAREVRATGVHWTYAPCIAIPQDIRWGRTYEGFGDNKELVSSLGSAYVKGLQGENVLTDLKKPDKIAACVKHFIGDGATTDGVNASDAVMSEKELREKYLPPYIEAVKSGVRSVMISYNSINGLECHANTHLITDILKKELEFDGIVISDSDGIDDISPDDYKKAVKGAVNAGVDIIMTPNKWKEAWTSLKELAEAKEVSMERMDDAVTRVLKVKYQLGLFENAKASRDLVKEFGSKEHREVAREAVRKSAVLLKNEGILPLQKSGKKIFVAGKCADDIGYQCGGWTISWKGSSGKITKGTSILEGIQNAVKDKGTVSYSKDGTGAKGNDIAVVVIGETPYAEGGGDSEDLGLDGEDLAVLKNVKEANIPMAVVIVSGRPLMIKEQMKDWDALVEAWLPGTEGDGISDVLFGDYDFTGRLPINWPGSMAGISSKGGEKPLFPYGFGLTYKKTGE